MLWLKRGETYDRDGKRGKPVDIHYDRNDLSFVRGKFRSGATTRRSSWPTRSGPCAWSSSRTRSSGSWSRTRSPARSSASGTSCTCSRPPTTWPARPDAPGHRRHRGRAGRAPGRAGGRWQAAGGPAAAHAHQLRPGDAARGRHLQRTENYSRPIDGRAPRSPPFTLIDYFDDFVLFLDESHVTVPQLQGQYEGRPQPQGDPGRARRFRLPSAMDNRPLRFDEFWERPGWASSSRPPPASTSGASRGRWWSRSSAPPAWSTPRSSSARPRARSTT